jgi:hypothetical protein
MTKTDDSLRHFDYLNSVTWIASCLVSATLKRRKQEPESVAEVCNPSYLEAEIRDQEECSLRPAPSKKHETLSEK